MIKGRDPLEKLQTLELYIKYEQLELSTLYNIFGSLDAMSVLFSRSKSIALSKNSFVFADSTILVEEVRTGESIRLRFTDGWKFGMKTVNGDAEIGLPKNIGIIAVSSFMLLLTARLGFGVYNDYLDSQLKELEIKIKEDEYYHTLIEGNDWRDSTFNRARIEAVGLVDYMMKSEEITHFSINDIPIKQTK